MLPNAIGSVNDILLSSCPTKDSTKTNYVMFLPVQCDLEKLKEVITSRIWSPITFIKRYRRKENFESSSLIALDFDNGVYSIEDMKDFAIKNSLWCMIGTTRHHQKEKKSSKEDKVLPPCDRFRMLFKASSVCENIDVYEYNLSILIEKFECDRNCKDGARYFFPCNEIVFFNEGDGFRWEEIPEHYLTQEKRVKLDLIEAQTHREKGTIPPWINRALTQGIPAGRRHLYCYTIALKLTFIGFGSDDIVEALIHSPLAAIGVDDVRRAAFNGIRKAKEHIQKDITSEPVGNP